MSPPLLGVEGEGRSTASLLTPSSPSSVERNVAAALKERNYLGLSDCSSVDSSSAPSFSEESKNTNLNLKATELRLGLPGSLSPARERDSDLPLKLDEKPLFPLLHSMDGIFSSSSSSSSSQKHVISGNKRGFSDAVEVTGAAYAEKNWMFHASGAESKCPQSVGKFPVNAMLSSSKPCVAQSAKTQEVPLKTAQERAGGASNHSSAPAAKAQVVGWPPIRSFRKNTLATSSKNNDEVDGKPAPAALFVKVSMDGAPYLRKVDLRTYSSYQELSSALEKMFSCFTIRQYGSHGAPLKEKLSESKLRDLLNGSEYVLTYEDKDGDWMLVGDVPWEMFIDSCKRLKIMKSSDAIGLAPGAKAGVKT